MIAENTENIASLSFTYHISIWVVIELVWITLTVKTIYLDTTDSCQLISIQFVIFPSLNFSYSTMLGVVWADNNISGIWHDDCLKLDIFDIFVIQKWGNSLSQFFPTFSIFQRILVPFLRSRVWLMRGKPSYPRAWTVNRLYLLISLSRSSTSDTVAMYRTMNQNIT